MKTLIETIVESTISWLDYLGLYGYDEATPEDIRIALAYDDETLLSRLDKLSKSEYDQIINESLNALQQEWELV